MSDFNNKLVTPSWIVISQLRPDIFIFSKMQKTWIIIELTGPCEENIKAWHQKKFEKYEPLSTWIKSNCWSVHLFTFEVGARASCLSHLGFPGKLLKSTIKELSLSSLQASFQILLSGDCKRWLEEKMTISPTETVSNVATPKTSKITSNCQAVQASVKNCGILNKGNTCYINATLQCLSTFVQFWSNFNGVSETLSPFVSSFIKIMSFLKSSKSALNSNFEVPEARAC